MLLFLAALAALVDGLSAEMRLGMNRLDALPATETAISGPIPAKAAEPEDFFVQGNSPDGQVKIVLDGFFASYWFGSGMWRGRLVVGDNPGLGDYPLVVSFKGAPARTAQLYHVVIWPDAPALQAGSFSFFFRELGWKPFVSAAVFGSAGLVMGLLNFMVGRRRMRLLQAARCTEVFKTHPTGDGMMEVFFGLGSEHGVSIGQECVFCREDGTIAARGSVTLCEPGHAAVVLPVGSQAQAGLVACPVWKSIAETAAGPA